MSLTLAAVGSVVAALLELTVAPYLRFGAAQPDLVLVFAIIWTMVVGFEGGLIWAFLGGLMIDLLAARPLGSTPFILLLCVGAAAGVRRIVTRARYLSPVLTVFVLALLFPALFLIVYQALRGPVPAGDPLAASLPRAVYDTLLAAAIAPTVALLQARLGEQERIDW